MCTILEIPYYLHSEPLGCKKKPGVYMHTRAYHGARNFLKGWPLSGSSRTHPRGVPEYVYMQGSGQFSGHVLLHVDYSCMLAYSCPVVVYYVNVSSGYSCRNSNINNANHNNINNGRVMTIIVSTLFLSNTWWA